MTEYVAPRPRIRMCLHTFMAIVLHALGDFSFRCCRDHSYTSQVPMVLTLFCLDFVENLIALRPF